jgi:serine/threonine protein phosphatase PrpC
MSKTLTAVLCETNQMRGLPQENIFLHNTFRMPADYGKTYIRTATATSPVQICAVASAQGEDTVAATSLQEVMKALSTMVAQTQTNSVLDFEKFVQHVISVTNKIVCTISLEQKGTPIRLSLTMLVIEGGVLRIVSVGNTRAVLVRHGNVIPLTEDQTLAHRYVQMGAIPPEAENTHPERNVLTQYIGRFAQDGPVLPEKQVNMKIMDGDEICLFGVGISQGLSDVIRNTILTKTTAPEVKSAELISRCMHNHVKGGLTALIMRIEATLLLPGAGVRTNPSGMVSSQLAAVPLATAATSLTTSGSMPMPQVTDKLPAGKALMSPRTKAIVIPVSIFLSCILVGYLGAFSLFNVGNFLKPKEVLPDFANSSSVPLQTVLYVLDDLVEVYPEESMSSIPITYLSRGEVVTLLEDKGSFSKISTTSGAIGFVLASMLSETDPTIGESIPDMTADPTPIPSYVTSVPTTITPTEPEETEETDAPITPSVTPSATPTTTPTSTPTTTPSATPTTTPTVTVTVTPTPT